VPPPRLLFGQKPDWEAGIQSRLAQEYAVAFGDLASCGDLEAYDAIVPLTCADAVYLSSAHPALGQRKFLAPSTEVLHLANDKVLFNQFLATKGYAEHLPGPAIAPPYILKKRIDEHGVNSRIVHDWQDTAYDPDQYFAQAFVPGPVEYATHILAKGGVIRYTSTRRYKFSEDHRVKGRSHWPDRTRTVDTEHIPLFQSIIRDLDYTGFACVDYKVHDGVVKIFELNPRMGGSLVSTLEEAMKAYLRALTEHSQA